MDQRYYLKYLVGLNNHRRVTPSLVVLLGRATVTRKLEKIVWAYERFDGLKFRIENRCAAVPWDEKNYTRLKIKYIELNERIRISAIIKKLYCDWHH